MNDFRKLQIIYEGGGMDVAGAGNPRYAPDPLNSNYQNSYRPFAFNSPPATNVYSAAEAGGMAGRIEAEEEIVTGDIEKKIVLHKLNDLLTRANKDEMQYAIHMLSVVKELIKAHA